MPLPENATELTTDGSAEAVALRAALTQAVARTCPRWLAVTLHLQGHSVPEVGALLAWTVKKAENLVYRGLADLRSCLSSKGLQP